MMESLIGHFKQNFMVHYNFMPFCAGEIKKPMLSRREVGHGALIKKALESTLNSAHDVIRIVADIMSADGSTSMSSVCAASIALMQEGLSNEYVAGVSVGLIDKKFIVDLTALEDNLLSEIDCKVAATNN